MTVFIPLTAIRSCFHSSSSSTITLQSLSVICCLSTTQSFCQVNKIRRVPVNSLSTHTSRHSSPLTYKVVCLLEVLLDVLVRRVRGRYLLVLQSRWRMTRSLAGDVQHAVGAHAQRVHRIPTITQQQVGKDERRRMCLDIASWRLTICGGANGDDFIIARRQDNTTRAKQQSF